MTFSAEHGDLEVARRAGKIAKTLLALSCAGWLVAVAGPAQSDGGGKLTIRVSGLEETKGEVLLSVANSREMFESDDEAFLSIGVQATAAEVSAFFEKVAAGEYAVKMFHDSNGNGEFDIGMLGPKEKYGFSNNVMGFMGPPDFEDAKFKFDGTELTIDIKAK